MEKQMSNQGIRRSEGDDLSNSNPNNIIWPSQISFQQTLMQPYNLVFLFQQYQGQQGIIPFGSGYPMHLNPPQNMAYGSQETHGHANQDEKNDHSHPSHIDLPSQATEENSTGVKGGNWSVLEDVRLCRAWVRVCDDPVVGTNQKKRTLWSRVLDDFVKHHEKNEVIIRNKKACELRMHAIKHDLNKWPVVLKKVHDCPFSGANELMKERTAHALYRGQNNKPFKLGHCWEIMSKCAIFMNSGNENKKNNVEIGSTRDNQSQDDFGETQIQIMTNENPINEESPKDPIIDESSAPRSRPPGRKAAKNAKRKASIEAHSSIGERMAKSLDEMQAASSVGWQKTL